jgi:hypothetical protein
MHCVYRGVRNGFFNFGRFGMVFDKNSDVSALNSENAGRQSGVK